MAWLSSNNNRVKKGITYRELTLVAGILVALLVVFTLWFRHQPQEAAGVMGTKRKAAVSLSEIARSFAKKTFAEIRN